ncbi:hypothetical protein DERP_009086 [Dermatophagoides pteronyssinus]|uniref:Uncharacterized protein n=1 Tax=Dermatophagoides pteronyssinus TaxID=6956 RepID=A0ABQ8JQH1_DERPT|nr:hypothetical protein DERP_009086 [Dermatophagoides pteronyssinus]
MKKIPEFVLTTRANFNVVCEHDRPRIIQNHSLNAYGYFCHNNTRSCGRPSINNNKSETAKLNR